MESLAVTSSNPLFLNDDLLADLDAVEKELLSGVRAETALPAELAHYLVESGGKRVRPYLMCLCFRKLSTPHHRCSYEDLITLATVAEWVHTATLFHDDVLDNSPARRGQSSAHILKGNKISILVGDFVYAEAFALLMDRGLLQPSQKLAHTIKKLVEGELLQHEAVVSRELHRRSFQRMAHFKTGSLFSWCTGVGAWAAGSHQITEAESLGQELGYTFQLADDLIDTFSLDLKNASDREIQEWVESAPPFPLVLAGENSSELQSIWRELPQLQDRNDMVRAIEELLGCCSNQEAFESCQKELQESLERGNRALETLGSPKGLSEAHDWVALRTKKGLELYRSRF